jgi:hypothetical protein
MSLDPGLLAVTDRAFTLYLLDTQKGTMLERIALTEDGTRMEKTAGRAGVVAAPWILGDLLVVPSELGVRAYAHDVARYRPKGEAPALAWLKEPPKRTDTASITIAVKATGADKELTLRYRCDEGEWKKESFAPPEHSFTIRQLPNGPHRCLIQVYDRHGRSSMALLHLFEVDCDHETLIKDIIVQLGAEQAKDRDRAESLLIDMGPPIIPFLVKYRAHEDPEIRLRVDRIRKALSEAHP